MGRAEVFTAVTPLGRGDHSLQPDPLVTHLFIVSWVVLAAWQLSEAVVDSGTLVSSNRDFWKVDRNSRVIQHIHLILNPEKTNMNYKPSK